MVRRRLTNHHCSHLLSSVGDVDSTRKAALRGRRCAKDCLGFSARGSRVVDQTIMMHCWKLKLVRLLPARSVPQCELPSLTNHCTECLRVVLDVCRAMSHNVQHTVACFPPGNTST